MPPYHATRRVALASLLAVFEVGLAGVGWLGATMMATVVSDDCARHAGCGCGAGAMCDVPTAVFVVAALLGVVRAGFAVAAARRLAAGAQPLVLGYLMWTTIHAAVWALIMLAPGNAADVAATVGMLAAWPVAFAVIVSRGRLPLEAPAPGPRPRALAIVAFVGFLLNLSWIVSLPVATLAVIGGETVLIAPAFVGMVIAPLWLARRAFVEHGALLWSWLGLRVAAGWLLLGGGLVLVVWMPVVAAIAIAVAAALLRAPPDAAPVPPARALT